MKEVVLKSGSKLAITLSPFAESKSLYQAVLEEAKELKVSGQDDIDVNLIKNVFCAGFASKNIEACVDQCMKRVTYNGLKIDEETFEPEKAREDYLEVCYHVAYENIRPFMKSLYAQYSQVLEHLRKSLA